MAVVGHRKTIFTFFTLLCCVYLSHQECSIPTEYGGDWYSMEGGSDISTVVDVNKWGNLKCIDVHYHPNDIDVDGLNVTMLMKVIQGSGNDNCFHCVDVLWRTGNILQYRRSDCYTSNSGFENMCSGINRLPSVDQVVTMFRKTVRTVNCNTIFEGVYQFTYESGGGICNNPDSSIEACQDPGSAYVDNEVFVMNYAKCPDVSSSKNLTIRYQCMGSWFAKVRGTTYKFAAIADTAEKDPRERYKCLITRGDQQTADNSVRWGMSRFADCRSLNSVYRAPTRLVLRLSRYAPDCQ